MDRNKLFLLVLALISIHFTVGMDTEAGWSRVKEFSAGFTAIGVACGSPDRVWLCGLNEATNTAQIQASTDGGINWTVQVSSFDYGAFMVDMDFVDDLNGWVAGGPSGSFGGYTHDGGATWTAIHLPYGLAQFQSVFALDAQRVYLVGFWSMIMNQQGVQVSTNGGTNWTAKTVESLSSVRYAYFINAQEGWMSSGTWPGEEIVNGKYLYRRYEHDPFSIELPAEAGSMLRRDGYQIEILHTTDGGNTWTSQFFNEGSYYPNDLFFINRFEGWVSLEADLTSALLHTSDGGATWNFVNFPSGNQHGLSDVEFVSMTEGFAFGMGSGGVNPVTAIIHTTDGGATWQRDAANFPAGIMYGTFANSDRGYTAGGNNMKKTSVIRYDSGAIPPTPTSMPSTPTATPHVSMTPTPIHPTATPSPSSAPASATPTPTAPISTPTEAPTDVPMANGAYVSLNSNTYHSYDEFILWVRLINTEFYGVAVEEYIVLDVYGAYWFYPTWTQDINSEARYLTPGYDHQFTILQFYWPPSSTPLNDIFFWAALLDQQTMSLFGNYSNCSFDFVGN